MNIKDAQTEAKRRWGPRGGVQVKKADNWPYWVGFHAEHDLVDFWPIGCGKTFEEAFEAADLIESTINRLGKR